MCLWSVGWLRWSSLSALNPLWFHTRTVNIIVFSESDEYCQPGEFSATCGPSEVIMADTAQYGRMRIGKCVKQNYGHLGCSIDVLKEVDRRCSGRHDCRYIYVDKTWSLPTDTWQVCVFCTYWTSIFPLYATFRAILAKKIFLKMLLFVTDR